MDNVNYYRHKVTGISAPMHDEFAAVFGDQLEKVSEKVAAKKTVESNAAELDAQEEPEAQAATNDSSKGGK